MLYSSSDDWKKERAWIVRFLADGIVSSEEWRILKRRHTWDLLASLFQSDARDRTLRRSILEARLHSLDSCVWAVSQPTFTGPCKRYMQWTSYNVPDSSTRYPILDGDATPDNACRRGRRLGSHPGQYPGRRQFFQGRSCNRWRMANDRGPLLAYDTLSSRYMVHSAFCGALANATLACSQTVFDASISVQLRLISLAGPTTSHIPALLLRDLHWLKQMETDITVPSSGSYVPPLHSSKDTARFLLHRSQHLFDPSPASSVERWGACVEALWRIATSAADRTGEWDALTGRLLIWRAIAGARGTRTGNWVRQAMVNIL